MNKCLEAILNFRGWQLIDINLEVCYKNGFFRGWSHESPPSLEREAEVSHHRAVSVVRWLNARTSLSLSIVNIWVQKNGSFSGKCYPALTRDFITPCSWHWQQWHIRQWKPLNCLGRRRSIKAACYPKSFTSHSYTGVNVHLIILLYQAKNIQLLCLYDECCFKYVHSKQCV